MGSTQEREEQKNRGLPIETPHGTVYPFKPFAVQIPVLFGAFAGGPVIAWLLGQVLGNVSEAGQVFLYVCFASVFFFGYGLWAARLASLVFNMFGRAVLWALLGLLLRRTKPEDLRQLIPDRDKLVLLMVSAQRAAWSFLVVGIVVGMVAGVLGLFIDSDSGKTSQMLLVLSGCILWGYALGWLGRHSYLPFPEPAD